MLLYHILTQFPHPRAHDHPPRRAQKHRDRDFAIYHLSKSRNTLWCEVKSEWGAKLSQNGVENRVKMR